MNISDYIDKVNALNRDSGRIYRYSSKTFGCQMNENDSEKIAGLLEEMGYVYEDDLEKSDLIFYNTCCVRQSAEEKTFGWIGSLKKLKEENKDLIICLTGCMTEQSHVVEKIKRSYPYVDIVLGTNDHEELPGRIFQKRTKTGHDLSIEHTVAKHYIARSDANRAYVTIMRGCNNYCSYCIVPYVRGREVSREKKDILTEISELADKGYKEITLLGQNVNSYGSDLGSKDGFSSLLYDICKINNIGRIRFMTSHPKDLSDSLIQAVSELDQVCDHIHLPLQSGSTKVLADMNRCYTKGSYLDLVDRIKARIPDITLTSDIIVGFPTETEKDFEDTLDVVKKASFDNSYMFIYSKRLGTKAAELKEELDEKTVKQRFSRLLQLQNDISYEMNKKMLGKTYKVLVEGKSKNNESMLTGRTEGNKLVHFFSDKKLTGSYVDIRINEIKSFSVEGTLINE
jgi:tRNA-2-methylthio-N6-dimethylallyladenosine synthase